MKRRNFLRAMGALSIPAISGIGTVRASSSSLFTSLINPDSDRVLVIIHLFGGNDGLNTLIPMDQYENLREVRNNLILPANSVHQLTDTLALHPAMKKMATLYERGRFSAVQSVGYPNQNRSHFRSTDIWNTGSQSAEVLTTGWMGRYLDTVYPNFPTGYPNDTQPHPPAISLGNVAHPTCEGPQVNFSHAVNDPSNFTILSAGGNTPLPDDNYGREVAHLRTTIDQTNVYGNIISTASDTGSNAVDYPRSNRLGEQLKHVARLISGGLKTKVYTVYLGGFDTHANQASSSGLSGKHAELLGQVSEAIAAFQEDLEEQGLDDRVLGLTFSEFGRRIRSNGSRGTDHGDAGPMFFFGSCLDATVIGDNPIIPLDIGQGEGVQMQFDFRDVYGSILVDWFQADQNRVRDVFHEDFVYLPVLSGCQASLPVTWLEFLAQAQEKTIALSWQTANETDNRGFEIERSTDGVTFTSIGWVSAAPPSATGQYAYQYEDVDVITEVTYYYRLRQVDLNGNFEYSPIRTARLQATGDEEKWQIGQVFPNPAADNTSIWFNAPVDGTIRYDLFTTTYQKVRSGSQVVFGQREGQLDIRLGRLPAAIYSLKILTPDGKTHQRKLVVR